MRYIFFFSYARVNHDEYLLRFYKDLRRRVEVLVGLTPEEKLTTEIAFLDERNLEVGADWEPDLFTALQNSSVLLCVYSPSYFVSEYCSREWKVFQLRRQHYRTLAGQDALPPTIKPIIWISPARRMTRETVHEDVWGVQYKSGATDADNNMIGVEQMLRMLNRYTVEYEKFLDELAQAILNAAELIPPLPELPPPLPRLSEVVPLFPLKRPPPVAAAPPNPLTPQPQNPLVFAAVRLRTSADTQDADPLPSWRPFGTDGATINFIAQAIAVRDLNTSCEVEQVATITELDQLIKRASVCAQALVILADAGNAALIAQAGVGVAHFPLLILGPAAVPELATASGATIAATEDALRAALVDQVPRLQSKTRALASGDLPSSFGKPVISASNR